MAYFRCTTSGSGTGATITVSYESEVYGQTLTCTDGTHTYTKTAASTGSTVFTVPNGGTWTISVVMFGHTYSQQVIVVSDYTCTLALWSATVNISTTATELYSQTITVKKGGSTIGSTAFDSSGSATYIAPEEGTYTFECTYSGQTYSASVNVTEETTYSVVISMGLELSQWLTAGGLDPSDYADLSEVLADEEAVRRLMTIHDSVDYIATASAGDQMMETIIADDICAKWINLRDYAFDVLSANADIKAVMDEVDKYGYGEWVLEGQVPVMTSNTAPYGVASASSTYSPNTEYYPWGSEINLGTTAGDVIGAWFGYEFTSPVIVKGVLIGRATLGTDTPEIGKFKVQAYDGSSWIDIDTEKTTSSLRDYFNIDNSEEYRKYRIYVTEKVGSGVVNNINVKRIQFYAYQPKGNVPIMTSNTAPYGEVVKNGEISGFEVYKMFDGKDDTRGATSNQNYTNNYAGYHFTNPIFVKKAYCKLASADRVTSYKIQGSNDGTNWTDLTEELTNNQQEITVDVDDTNAYLYVRFFAISGNTGFSVYTLQFYGREMKVSVPAMTSNTAPWGEASESTYYANGYKAWNAFDKVDYSSSNNQGWCPAGSDTLGSAYVQYKFISPTVVKQLFGGYKSGSGNYTFVFKLVASNDNSDWIELDDEIIMTTKSTTHHFDIENANAYVYYRLILMENRTDGRVAAGGGFKFQFFGFDYSERDWDTEHPIRYLYDHGVELETITLSGTATKEPDDIKLSAASSDATATLDTTDYDLLRAVVGKYASGTNVLKAGSGSATFTAANMPYNQSLDVSNISGSNAVGVGQTANGIFTAEEWWLE